MSEAQNLDIQLAQMREELSNTVNELAGRFTPEYLGGEAKKKAQEKVEDAKDSARNLLGEALSGDKRAVAILGGIAAGAVLILARIIRH